MDTDKINITLNGKDHLTEQRTVLELLRQINPKFEGFGIAVARNQVVLDRDSWATTSINANDKIEVLRAFQGG